MALEIGSRLGPYEIVGKLGAGGMGEVYRARDARLDRDVALKVLPAEVVNDPVRRARFEQEARAAAALTHPHIVGTYDVGSEAGVLYIVSELVEGEGLDAILSREQLPTRRVLELATQIADGMACAHAAGITHRDLKPANVMIGRDGRAKILDFGLAKRADRSAPRQTDATVTVHHTDPGMIVGTVNYMSPEQASGKPVDTASDQFAFGVILYEMVTGKKAFERPTGVQTMSAILTDDPPPIERTIPAPLRWVIERCLAKEPGERYASTRDLYRDLRTLHERLSEASTTQMPALVAPAPPRRRRWMAPAAILAAAAAALTGGYLIGARQAPPVQLSYRPFSFFAGGQDSAVWSADGKAVAFAGRESAGAPSQIWVRYLDSPTPTRLTNIPEGGTPLAWIGPRIFFVSGKAPAGWWSVAAVGGEPESVFPGANRNIVRGAISPDGKAGAFLRGTDAGVTLWISSPLGTEPAEYKPAPFIARDVYGIPSIKFSPDGKQLLVLVNRAGPEEGWLIPFPASESNPPRLVFPAIRSFSGTPAVSWMPDNRRVVLSAAPASGAPMELLLGDTQSGEVRLLASGTTWKVDPSVSPDGKRMVFGEFTVDQDIVSINVSDASISRIAQSQREENMPAWALRKEALVYVSDRNGRPEIWLRSAAGERPIVSDADFPEGATQWFMSPALSPEADRVIYTRVEAAGRGRAWISAVAGGAPVRLTNDDAPSEFSGSWSPDGAWFVYSALSDGKFSLMKVRTSGQAAPVVLKEGVQPAVSSVPMWSPDGEWIEFSHQGESLISADGKTERKLQAPPGWAYAFSADGKQIYGVRGGRNPVLFSFPVAGGPERTIGSYPAGAVPGLNLSPARRLSLSPDGKSLVFPSRNQTLNLWMMEGLQP